MMPITDKRKNCNLIFFAPPGVGVNEKNQTENNHIMNCK